MKPLKPLKVDTVRSSNGLVTADVMLNRDTKTFFVEVSGRRVEAPTAADAMKQGRKALDDSQSHVWEELIEVSAPTEDWRNDPGEVARLAFVFRRFERAVDPMKKGEHLERPHRLDVRKVDEERRAKLLDVKQYCGRRVDPGPADHDGHEPALVAYDQKVWDRLVGIQVALTEIGTKLQKLLERPDVAEVLASGRRENVFKLFPEEE